MDPLCTRASSSRRYANARHRHVCVFLSPRDSLHASRRFGDHSSGSGSASLPPRSGGFRSARAGTFEPPPRPPPGRRVGPLRPKRWRNPPPPPPSSSSGSIAAAEVGGEGRPNSYQSNSPSSGNITIPITPAGTEGFKKAEVTAGGHSASRSWADQPIVTYQVSKGLFAGVNVKDTTIRRDDDAMDALYGGHTKTEDVLAGKIAIPMTAQSFIDEIERIETK